MADKVLQSILAAGFPEDVFGALPGDKAKQLHDLKAVFRQLVQVVHPDHHVDKAAATGAFTRLTAMHAEAEAKIEAGTYGVRKAAEPKAKPSPVVVRPGELIPVPWIVIARDSCSDRMQNPADQGHHMPDMWIHTMAGRCGRCGLEIVRAKGREYMARLPWTRKWVDAKTDLTCDFVLTQAVHES